MPATYKFVLTTWADSTQPSDGLQITPTFHHKLTSPNLEQMCNDLLDGWYTWLTALAKPAQQRVTVYDLQGTPPVYPAAQVQRNSDVSFVSGINRDIAVCLSAYAGENRPRKRGRLYIPLCLAGSSPTGANVSASVRQRIADLVPLFEGLGGVDWDWGVFSRVDNVFRKYTNWWVDDAWDTQRRRGKRATARTTGTTSG
jgi:hypothetical protein